MIKFMMTFDKDKEAKWLTEMANEGWAMKRFFAGFYTFEECEKGKYQYQVDFCDKVLRVSKDYKEFMADNDIEIVQQWGFWVILRKLSSAGEFELYSDVDSQIAHYKKVLRMFQGVTGVEFLVLLYEVYAASTLHSLFAWAAVFAIMALIVVFINVISNTNNIIQKLNERKTGIVETKKTNLSPVLAAGFMFNACAVCMDKSSTFKLIIQIIAIILMLSGIILTCKRVKNA